MEIETQDKKNVKLTIEYEGTNYHGWQRQLNANTVQQEVERAIEKITNEKQGK